MSVEWVDAASSGVRRCSYYTHGGARCGIFSGSLLAPPGSAGTKRQGRTPRITSRPVSTNEVEAVAESRQGTLCLRGFPRGRNVFLISDQPSFWEHPPL